MYSINKITSNPTVDFAAEELKKYLRMMMPDSGEIVIKYAPGATDGFRLGLMADFGIDTSEAEDLDLDDILHIDTDEMGGIIAGSNPRSVLLAVYKYLTINGCRWLFPGIDGEFIPVKDVEATKYHKMADCRYRGQCNEGAEYQPNMMEVIDFTPKIGMNIFMIEFENPYAYYASYYNHRYNEKNREPEPVTRQTVLQWKRQCEAEIAKRGIQFHDMGHGWATIPFGIDSTKMYKPDVIDETVERARPHLAQVNGKRGLFNDTNPYYTNFCLGKPENRKIVVDYVVNYAEKASNVDYLHVWLADSTNHTCECEACQAKTHSDWYIVFLNEIDAELTKRNLNTRIVCICYYDTLLPPEEETLNNPKRFSLLLAPLTRLYTESVSPERKEIEFPPYVRNGFKNPKDPSVPVAMAEAWEKKCGLKVLVYEYHFWVNQYYEPTQLEFAKIIHDDIKGYYAHGFNGTIEDGSQRSFFPNGFNFYVYAQTLFDTSVDFEELKRDYFSTAYGEDYEKVLEFLEKLNGLMDYKFIAGERSANEKIGPYFNPEMGERLRGVRGLVEEFRPFVEEHKNMPYRAQTVAFRLLRLFLEYAEGYADFMILKAFGAAKEARALCNKFMDDFGVHELAIERYFDISNFGSAMYWRILKKDEEAINYGIAEVD